MAQPPLRFQSQSSPSRNIAPCHRRISSPRTATHHPGSRQLPMSDAESSNALPYDFFAPAYDHIFGPEAAGATWQALEQLLLPELEPSARLLDLCCGTGELAHQFARRGYLVVGLDN